MREKGDLIAICGQIFLILKDSLDIVYISLYLNQASFKNLCKGRENRNVLSSEFFMVKYGKRGNQGGSKGANRTGKTNPNACSSGEDVTKESHRTGTQKYGGHKSGPRR